MSRGRVAWIATIGGTLAATLGAAAPAHAATYGTLDISYTGTSTNFSELPSRRSQATYHPCTAADAQTLVGIGGAVIESSPPQPNYSAFKLGKAYNVSLQPFEQVPGAPNPDSNRQVAEIRFRHDDYDVGLVEVTVCAAAIGQVSYRTSEEESPGQGRTSVEATCPGGTHVVSGGGKAPGPFRSQRLVASAPFDTGDAGSEPDDGWRVAVDNPGNKDRTAKAYAICADQDGLSYVSDAWHVQKRSRKHVEVDCPPGEYVLGGGIKQDIPFEKATLVASRFPFTTFDSWITELDNLSTAGGGGRSFAICHA